MEASGRLTAKLAAMRSRPRHLVDAEPNMFDVMDQLALEQYIVDELGGSEARKMPIEGRQPPKPQDP